MAMPWKESSHLNERMLFVSRVKSGEKVSDLCLEFGISRKTAHKFLARYDKFGPVGLHDMSRRPHFSPNQTPEAIKNLIVKTKQEKPTWGAGKLREWLLRKYPEVKIPSRFTVHEILNQYNLINHRRGKRKPRTFLQTHLTESQRANQIWCIDFKGQFQMGNRSYCYPLTLTDHFSRYLILCEALENTQGDGAQLACEMAFREYGLPDIIRSDNGPPFASMGLYGLSKLSVWWLRLGIQLQRIEPGRPDQNGRHERMHLTLKQDTTRPAGDNLLQQQEKFDSFKEMYNLERPHEALDMKCPSQFYEPSTRAFPESLSEPEYPFHDQILKVAQSGKITFEKHLECHLTQALAYQTVGLREEGVGLWRITFMDFDLGLFDADEKKFKPFSSLATATTSSVPSVELT